MRKYAVLKVFTGVSPIVVFQTDDHEDAVAMAGIMNRADGYAYAVVTLDATVGEDK